MSVNEPELPNLFPEVKEPEPLTPNKSLHDSNSLICTLSSLSSLSHTYIASSKSLGALSSSWSEKSFFDRPLSVILNEQQQRSQSPIVESISLTASSSSSILFSPPTTKSIDLLSKQAVIPESIPVFNAKQEEEYIQGEVTIYNTQCLLKKHRLQG